jgi:hypothetical protein
MASRKTGTPVMGGYWFKPDCMAPVTASTSLGSQSKSGNPCPKLTALCSVAKADMTVKIVVPTDGSLVSTDGVRGVISDFISSFQICTAMATGVEQSLHLH